MGIRLMIIELRKYNKIGELLIGDRVTGSQAQVSYQDEVREASTRAAICMGVKGMAMRTGHRGAYNRPPRQDREQVCVWALQINRKGISMQ